MFQRIDATAPDNPFVMMISGSPGCGKTHLSLTQALHGPVWLLDTENRSEWIVKNRFAKVMGNIQVAHMHDWKEFREACKIIRRQIISGEMHPGTVIIDSASDMDVFAQQDIKTSGRWHQTSWGKVRKLQIDFLKFLKDLGCDVVLTSQVKEVYRNNEGTGEYIPRAPQDVLHFCDAVLFNNGDMWTVMKNAWGPMDSAYTTSVDFYNTTVQRIVNALQNPEILTTGASPGWYPQIKENNGN